MHILYFYLIIELDLREKYFDGKEKFTELIVANVQTVVLAVIIVFVI